MVTITFDQLALQLLAAYALQALLAVALRPLPRPRRKRPTKAKALAKNRTSGPKS